MTPTATGTGPFYDGTRPLGFADNPHATAELRKRREAR